MEIAGRRIGPDAPPYLVAELSGNHRGEIRRAYELIDAARAAGADAVKLQTYTADTLTIDHDGPGFRLEGGPWDGRRLYELYQEAATPWEWHAELFAHARRIGVTAFSSPFDPTAVALLRSLDAPAYKIASFELVDLPLIAAAAACGKPLIMSTGVASDAEVAEAVATARDGGAGGVMLLHCTSAYPAPPREMHLRTIPDLAARYAVPVGLSDHTLGSEVAVAAVALGAVLIEKHFTLRRSDGGPDAAFSLEPDEFARLARETRNAWDALGVVRADDVEHRRFNAEFRRSLYVVADVRRGDPLTMANVRSIRPGYGLAPKYLARVLAGRAARDLRRGTPLAWDMVEGA